MSKSVAELEQEIERLTQEKQALEAVLKAAHDYAMAWSIALGEAPVATAKVVSQVNAELRKLGVA